MKTSPPATAVEEGPLSAVTDHATEDAAQSGVSYRPAPCAVITTSHMILMPDTSPHRMMVSMLKR